jgi:hypothetical protein
MAGYLAFKGIKVFPTCEGSARIGVLCMADGGKVPFLKMPLMVDRFNSANDSSVRFIRPKVADAVLTSHPDNWKFFAEVGCTIFPTSAVAAYSAPGIQPGSTIMYPGFNGQQLIFSNITHIDCGINFMLLVPEVTSASLHKTNKNQVLLAAAVVTSHSIPTKSGLYLMLPGEVVPSSYVVLPDSPDVRYLERTESGNMVTPIVREIGDNGERTKLISLACSPFEKYDLVVEMSAKDTGRFAPYIPWKDD